MPIELLLRKNEIVRSYNNNFEITHEKDTYKLRLCHAIQVHQFHILHYFELRRLDHLQALKA